MQTESVILAREVIIQAVICAGSDMGISLLKTPDLALKILNQLGLLVPRFLVYQRLQNGSLLPHLYFASELFHSLTQPLDFLYLHEISLTALNGFSHRINESYVLVQP